MSGCSYSLTQGRYTWRHDQVLRELAIALDQERKKKRVKKPGLTFIQFKKSGEKAQSKEPTQAGLLRSGQWEMRADLDGKLVFPQEIVTTQLRPDIVLWAKDSKQLAMVELTVPWEERVEEAYHLKRDKYTDLQASCIEKGWKTWVLPVEIGCRGFPSRSLWSMFRTLGVNGKTRKAIIRRMSESAERASCWLWRKRTDRMWTKNNL